MSGTQCFVINKTENFGEAAFATRDISAGEVVLEESPLLWFKAQDTPLHKQLDEIGMAHGLPPTSLYPLYDFIKSPTQTQDLILQSLYCPDIEAPPQYLGACGEIHQRVPDFAYLTAQKLVRFLLIVDVNLHKDHHGERLYYYATKFAHSCNPNMYWAGPEGAILQYCAMRPIKAGEMLTFSYIGYAFNMVRGTAQRRRELQQLGFVCQCQRCTQADLSRRMRCPVCGDSSAVRLPVPEAGTEEAAMLTGRRPTSSQGTQHIQARLEAEMQSLAVQDAAKPWKCGGCQRTWSDAEMPLLTEAHFGHLVTHEYLPRLQAAPGAPVGGVEQLNAASRMLEACTAVLGENHWASVLMTYTLLATYHTQLKARQQQQQQGQQELLPANRVLGLCDTLMAWFTECIPGSMQQSKAAALVAEVLLLHGMPRHAAKCLSVALNRQRVWRTARGLSLEEMEQLTRQYEFPAAD
eukprot:TRINITY_DN3535_c1_g2_i1.p3 TRINITY_DN3535_c1_g2~~TRINITY_DN3535_c1_g2_i1.p3  ORF type:complete len:465 (-),score=106.06 TRINITY_DN3535_c1_g2_i1:959-2353(-)